MEIQFLGGTGTVTGSKYLLSHKKALYLIDCGLFQGLKTLRLRNWASLPFDPAALQGIVLTHAHIDHSGYLPLLIKNGFKGRIYCTEATFALCKILLPDSGRLQEEDAFLANKTGFSRHHPAKPLYSENEALQTLEYFTPLPWLTRQFLSEELLFKFSPAGHILGAASIFLSWRNQSLVFSGDLGRFRSPIMKAPASRLSSDYLVLESTYGDRKHSEENLKKRISEEVTKTIGEGGIVLIPAFAVGRAQEILYLLVELKKERLIPSVPIYLNSPMALKALKILKDFPNDHSLTSEEVSFLEKNIQCIGSVEEAMALNRKTDPSIIVSASGMATGGRVLHHLKTLAPHSKNLILFGGYQALGTRGQALISGVDAIKIHGEWVPVKARVANLEALSAHADVDEIMTWLKTYPKAPQRIFITHGEPLASEALRKRIKYELRWEAEVPDYLQTYSLT